MIYFDNASTGGFKPNAVIESASTVIKYLSANPNRSGHRKALVGMETIHNTRTIIAKHFNCSSDRVIFTKNCTESLNTAILGSLKVGGHVITTVYEHNSVLRPLTALQNKGLISLDIVSPYGQTDLVSAIKEKICDKTYMIVLNAVSNVTGIILPVQKVGELAKKHNLLFVVDGAQAGGHIDLDMKENNISMLALAGHKGLYGIMGSGVLLLDDSVDLEPLTYGGTGTESDNLCQPTFYPERLESGTLNLPAISSLYEGMNYLVPNQTNFATHLTGMTKFLIDGLKKINRVSVYSIPNPCGIVAFAIKDIESGVVADILNRDYDIAVRGGLHCAPLIHKYLHTFEHGLVRASLAVQNSSHELSFFIKSISEIASR